jgi:hypothetical protein
VFYSLNDTAVTCPHGPLECDGNIHELCAINLASKQQNWWEFLQCLNFAGKDNVGDPGLAQKCADVANLLWKDQDGSQGIQSCVEGGMGERLLRESITQSGKLGIR